MQAFGLVTSFDIISQLRAKQIETTNLSVMLHINQENFPMEMSWMDELQDHFECCGAHGVHGYSFWMNFEPYHSTKSLPESCCIQPNPNCARDIIGQPFLAAYVSFRISNL